MLIDVKPKYVIKHPVERHGRVPIETELYRIFVHVFGNSLLL